MVHNDQGASLLSHLQDKMRHQVLERNGPQKPLDVGRNSAQMPRQPVSFAPATKDSNASRAAASGTVETMIQTSPRILDSPRLDLSLALTGSGLEWLFGSKWQWFAEAKGEGLLELCTDGSLICPSAGKHAHWWTDEQGRINMEWGNRLGLHILLMEKSKTKMTGVRVSGGVPVEAVLASVDPEAQKAAAAASFTVASLTPRGILATSSASPVPFPGEISLPTSLSHPLFTSLAVSEHPSLSICAFSTSDTAHA